MGAFKYLILALTLIAFAPSLSQSQLSTTFYSSTCPSVTDTVKSIVRSAINREKRMGASLLRLFFHDCFVVIKTIKIGPADEVPGCKEIQCLTSKGCDGGVLLDDNLPTIDSEKNSLANKDSLRGFEVIDKIKDAVDKACAGPVVSCADILAIAARDSVVELGGPRWEVNLGRKDARTVSRAGADNLPSPFASLQDTIDKFSAKGFTAREMVALSGAHSIGMARCFLFRAHLYNGTNLETLVASDRKSRCPSTGGDNILSSIDHQSPNRFGNNYFQGLMKRRGLLRSDQELFNGGSVDDVVKTYSQDSQTFYTDFANAMIKMGNLNPLTGDKGEIRKNCKKLN